MIYGLSLSSVSKTARPVAMQPNEKAPTTFGSRTSTVTMDPLRLARRDTLQQSQVHCSLRVCVCSAVASLKSKLGLD